MGLIMQSYVCRSTSKNHHRRSQSCRIAISLWLVATICSAAVTSDQLIIEAAKKQDWQAVDELVEQNVNVNATAEDGATTLHWCSYHDDVDSARLLIQAGSSIDARNAFGITPLSLACTNGSASMIRTLLIAGADPNLAIETGDTPLMTAARSGTLDAVVALLDHGADVNASEPDQQQTALIWALSEGHVDVAKTLIENGANVHAVTKGKFTTVMFAARVNDGDSVRALIDAGVDIGAAASDGHTALHVATLRGFSELAMYLLDQGADPNVDDPGYTPLHWAVGTWETEMTGQNGITTRPDHQWSAMHGVQFKKLELEKHLLDHGADPNARLKKNPRRYGFTFASARPKGSTPFALAALAGNVAIMQMLVDNGADPKLIAERGVTPLMMACGVRRNLSEDIIPLRDSLEAVKLIVELGANVNAADERYGDTALHGAARIKSAQIVQHLVDHGAEVNVVNKRGQSPLYFAERYWPPGIAMIHQPSAAGDLLRKLTLRDAVKESVDRWAEIPRDVRDEVEAKLQGELDKLNRKEDRREEDPIFPPEGGFPES